MCLNKGMIKKQKAVECCFYDRQLGWDGNLVSFIKEIVISC